MNSIGELTLRKIITTCAPKKELRYLSAKNIGNSFEQFHRKNVAYESNYYYRQDKELLKLLKQKTEEEVKIMQNKVRVMELKLKEYNRDISESLRFLESLNVDPGKKRK